LNLDTKIENIEKAIFVNSLDDKQTTRALVEMYAKLIQLQHEISGLWGTEDFEEVRMKELIDLSYKVTENILNLRICIREKLGLDTSQDIDEMRELWQSRV